MPEVRLIDANALHAKILEENRRNYAATENVAQILLRIETAPKIEAEPVRHGKGCSYCKGRSYTKKPLTVITRTMKRVEVCFNFCPNCGRDMRATDTNVGGKGGADNGRTETVPVLRIRQPDNANIQRKRRMAR